MTYKVVKNRMYMHAGKEYRFKIGKEPPEMPKTVQDIALRFEYIVPVKPVKTKKAEEPKVEPEKEPEKNEKDTKTLELKATERKDREEEK